MPLYLTFTTAKVKIKLQSYFFPNSHGCTHCDVTGLVNHGMVKNTKT